MNNGSFAAKNSMKIILLILIPIWLLLEVIGIVLLIKAYKKEDALLKKNGTTISSLAHKILIIVIIIAIACAIL